MEERIGHYTIISELGRGGMGVVYKAHEESLNRLVALKVLGRHLSEDDSFVARFKREAQSAAALNHPNIVQVYAISEFDGQHCFAMEFVNGSSISDLIKKSGPMDPVKAARLILQAASGLGAAHGKGIYHRDIKPANLMVDESGLVKIADFGLALLAEGTTRLTSTGMFMGTPGYLSPEQCLGEGVDQRTDIYSLGVTLYEMLTGVTPLKADSPLALLRQVIDVEPRDVGELRPEVPESLRSILRKMMAKKPDDRYQDCAALILDLQSWLESAGGAPSGAYSGQGASWAGPHSDSQATVVVGAPASKSATIKVSSPSSARRNVMSALLIVVSLAVLAGASFAAWKYVVDKPGENLASNTRSDSPFAPESATGAENDWENTDIANDAPELLQDPGFAISNYPEPAGDQDSNELDLQGAQEDWQLEPVADASDINLNELPDNESALFQPDDVPAATLAANADDAESVTPADSTAGSISQSASQSSGQSSGQLTGESSTSPANGTALASHTQGSQLAGTQPAKPVISKVGSGVAIISEGEVLLADSTVDYVRQTLSRYGISVIDGMTIPGVAERLSERGTDIQSLIRPRARYLVYIRADYVGERQLFFMGRPDIELQSRLNMDTHDLLDGSVMGEGIHASVGYTALSVADKVQELLRPGFTPVAQRMSE